MEVGQDGNPCRALSDGIMQGFMMSAAARRFGTNEPLQLRSSMNRSLRSASAEYIGKKDSKWRVAATSFALCAHKPRGSM